MPKPLHLNTVALAGNVFTEPQAGQGPKSPWLRFRLVFDERLGKNADGSAHTHANFIDCIVFGPYAEALERGGLSKGEHVVLMGHLHMSSWTDKDSGKSRSSIGLIVERIERDRGSWGASMEDALVELLAEGDL